MEKETNEYPYIIYREKSFVNNKVIYDEWSSPKFLFSVKSNDLRKLKNVEEQLKKPEDTPDEPKRVRLKAIGRDWDCIIGDVRRGCTEVRICLPAGTIFSAFEV